MLKEIVYDYEFFKSKINKTEPIHFDLESRTLDRFGLSIELVFRLYGITSFIFNPNERIIVIFEKRETVNTNSTEFYNKWQKKEISHDEMIRLEIKERYDKFIKEYCEPLKATEGKWSL